MLRALSRGAALGAGRRRGAERRRLHPGFPGLRRRRHNPGRDGAHHRGRPGMDVRIPLAGPRRPADLGEQLEHGRGRRGHRPSTPSRQPWRQSAARRAGPASGASQRPLPRASRSGSVRPADRPGCGPQACWPPTGTGPGRRGGRASRRTTGRCPPPGQAPLPGRLRVQPGRGAEVPAPRAALPRDRPGRSRIRFHRHGATANSGLAHHRLRIDGGETARRQLRRPGPVRYAGRARMFR